MKPPQSNFFQQDPPKDDWITAYSDGGSRGNPGPAGFGVSILSSDGQVIAELSEYIGHKSNNVAEYSGMLAALDYALEHGHTRLKVVSDSELMVKQIQGKYKVASPDLRPLYDEAKRRIARLDRFEISHVLRGKNKDADRLANEAMDHGMNGGTGRKPSAIPAFAPPTPLRPSAPTEKPRPLRGIMKNGQVTLLEGSIPDGTIVVVMPERALLNR